VADLIFVALLGVLAFTPLSVRLLGDAGIGWHIRAGQQILATHSIPRVDSFSSTMTGKPWFAWEWLYDVVVGALDSSLGLNGVVWLTAVVIAAVFAWTFRLLIARGVNVAIAVALTLLAVSASTIHFLARPHVLSWLFTLAWFWILESSERSAHGSRKRMWLLPPVMLLWVNLHGGFLVGFVLLGIFWLSALWDWYASRSDRIEESLRKIAAAQRVRDLVWVGLASLAATFVNPYGWKLHAHIYAYVTNRFLMDHVEEFQSPNFHSLAPRFFALLLLITLAVLAACARRVRMSEGLTTLFAVHSALYSARSIPVSSILLVLVIGRLLRSDEPAPQSAGFIHRMTAVESRMRGHLWCLAAVLATLTICVNGGRLGSSQLIDAHFGAKRMPVDAVKYLEENPIPGPVLSPDYWGGYLIYRLAPKTKVVIDDRHDLYGETFLRPYVTMIRGEAGWQAFLREHEAGCILLPRDAAITNLLVEDSEWKAIYVDDVAIAFVRR
jgi:hypothetical protein